MMQRQPRDPNDTNSPTLIVLNKRELGTVNAMLRIVDDLIWYQYAGANRLYADLVALIELCGPDEDGA